MSRAAVCAEEMDKTGHVSCSERQRERERAGGGVCHVPGNYLMFAIWEDQWCSTVQIQTNPSTRIPMDQMKCAMHALVEHEYSICGELTFRTNFPLFTPNLSNSLAVSFKQWIATLSSGVSFRNKGSHFPLTSQSMWKARMLHCCVPGSKSYKTGDLIKSPFTVFCFIIEKTAWKCYMMRQERYKFNMTSALILYTFIPLI